MDERTGTPLDVPQRVSAAPERESAGRSKSQCKRRIVDARKGKNQMPESHVKFHSANGKRSILIVEDENLNRCILSDLLEETYEVIEAETSAEALEKIYANRETISLILLDLILPDGHGMDILHQVRTDPLLTRIPVIVMTADRDAEVESLNLGAIDFIPKPYPAPEVLLARIRRTIELCENRDIIRVTERDALTGLYNREYFYRYAEQFDLYHKEMPMDAIVVDINHFHIINERYGKAYADDVLRRIGEKIRETVSQAGGIVCRRESDVFMVYCPHGQNWPAILEHASDGLDSRVRLRMGIYAEVDKSIDIERRFDRAKLAADTVRGSFSKTYAVYDKALHENEIFTEQLLEDFPGALEDGQFEMYYQPKFDIRPATPILNGSEALVRWNHPALGMLSPDEFVPVFEGNGLIQLLDSHIWRLVAAQMRDWKERLGVSVPVSVNVSRVDLLDAELDTQLTRLLQEFDLTPSEFLLEITESAYTEDSEQIVTMVGKLREAGFHIEMDDFGSGYSSLNMISAMPVDAIKLDMEFIRNAFRERKNTRMLDLVIDIAESLEVPTIAEGVETAEQVFALKSMGCEIVQGFYFSRPIPAREYEAFLLARKNAIEQDPEEQMRFKPAASPGEFAYDALHDPTTRLYNHSAYEVFLRDADQNHIALLIASVDDFDALRTVHGLGMIDRIVVRIADALRRSFRSVDYICRIGNDEFVIIMSRVSSDMRDVVFHKVEQINGALQQERDGMPPVSLSVGVAFGDRENPRGDIFHDADTALSRIKEMKRSGCAIY